MIEENLDSNRAPAVAADAPRRKWRFSLRRLFLVCVVTTIAVSHIIVSVRLYFANSELRELRREVGYLDVRDVNLPHVVAVKTLDDMTWKWKLYLPPGRKFVVREFLGDAPPAREFDADGSHVQAFEPMFTGYVDLELTLRKDSEGQWVRRFVVTKGGSSISNPAPLPTELIRQLQDDTYSRSVQFNSFGRTIQMQLNGAGTTVEPLHLVRLSLQNNGQGTPSPREPTYGVFVRLEEEP